MKSAGSHLPRHRGRCAWGSSTAIAAQTARAEIAIAAAAKPAPAAIAKPAASHNPQSRTPVLPAPAASVADYNGLVKRYCVGCHNDRNKDRAGSLTLASFDIAKAGQEADVAERMIRKLQASMMPPPGMPRPEPAVYQSFIRALETHGRCAREGQSESGRPHVPAPESPRVRARGQGPARPRRQCRQAGCRSTR